MEIPCQRHTLANGLSVVAARGPRVPDRGGEHLVSRRLEERAARPHRLRAPVRAPDVRGSAHHDRGYFQPLQGAGAPLNGSTNADRTNYWEVVPTGALELALWMESDRMGYLLPALTDAKFANQRDVVLNERRQNYENRPYGLAAMAMLAALFPPDHPYHWMTIGVRRRSAGGEARRGARVLRDATTIPANASLAIAGDIDPETRRSRSRNGTSARFPPGPRVARRRAGAADADRRPAAVARGSRRAAAAVPGVAFAGDVRGRRRGARSRDRPARQRQDVAPLSPARLRAAHRDRRRGVAELARDRQLLPGRRDRRAGPHAGRDRARHRPKRSRGSPRKGRPTRRSSGAWRRPRRSSSSGCRRSAASAASRDQLNAYNVFLGDPARFEQDLERYRSATRRRRWPRATRTCLRPRPRVAQRRSRRDRRGLALRRLDGLASGVSDRSIARGCPRRAVASPSRSRPSERSRCRTALASGRSSTVGCPSLTMVLLVRVGARPIRPDSPGLAALTGDMLDEGAAIAPRSRCTRRWRASARSSTPTSGPTRRSSR